MVGNYLCQEAYQSKGCYVLLLGFGAAYRRARPAVGAQQLKGGLFVCGVGRLRFDTPKQARLEVIASQAPWPTLNALCESVRVWWQADEAI